MAMYLKITDGTTTFDLLGNDPANYFNLEASTWAPNVATRKQGGLGGDPYTTVIERIPLYVSSTTDAAALLANLEKLTALIEQAGRWWSGEAVDAVTIRYSPNSNADYVEAAILGPPPGEPAIVLPDSFADDLYQNLIDGGVVLQFERRGLWLDNTADTVTSSDTTMPAVLSVTLSEHDTPSPADITLQQTGTQINSFDDVLLIAANGANTIEILEPETEGGLNGFTAVSESSARGGVIVRMNTGITNGSIHFPSLSIDATLPQYAVFAHVRNTGSINYSVYARQRYVAVSDEGQKTNTSIIHAGLNGGNPIIQFIGFMQMPPFGTLDEFSIYVAADATVTSGNELEIDSIIIASADNIINAKKFNLLFGETLNIQHLSTSHNKPLIYKETTTFFDFIDYSGDIFCNVDSANYSVCVFPHNNYAGVWGPSSISTINCTVARRRGYLVPQ